MKTASKPEEMPKTGHFAILYFGSTWTEGYDAHDQGYSSPCVTRYDWTIDQKEWEQEVIKLTQRKGYMNDAFVPLMVTLPKVETVIKVSVNG